MKHVFMLVFLALAGCTSATLKSSSSIETSVVVHAGQDPLHYAGFESESSEGVPYALSGPQVRDRAEYKDLVGQLEQEASPELTSERFMRILRAMLTELKTGGKFAGDEGEKALKALSARVDAMETALKPYASLPFGVARGDPAVPKNMWVAGLAKDVDQLPGARWSVKGFFLDSAADRIPMYAVAAAADDTEKFFVYLSDEQAWSIASFCALAELLENKVIPIEGAAASLEKIDLAWDNYLQRGYGQFPWENYLNDHLVSSAADRPPTHQFVFLHPEPGFVVLADELETAAVKAALLLQVVGYVYYFDDDRGWFLGGSLTGAITSDEDQGFGYGATLHAGDSSPDSFFPHLDIGVLWHEGSERDGLMIAIGFDVARLLSSD